MATGGDSIDSGRKNICNICEKGDLIVTADYLCASCEQYLCGECKLYHSRVNATKSHQVLGTDEIPTLSSLTLGSEAMETPICTEHGRRFEHFCVNHLTSVCQTCKLIEHKACTSIIELTKAACDVYSEGHSRDILKSMEALLDGFSKCNEKAQNSKDDLYKYKDAEINKVKQTITNIKSYVDKLGSAACEEIGAAFADELNKVEDRLHVCDVSSFQLQKRKTKLERAMELDDEESLFVIINSLTAEIKRKSTLLKEVLEDTSDIDIKFNVSYNIGRITQIIPNLGTVSVTESPSSQPDTETVAIYTGELKARTATDTRDPVIMSYKVLPDGRHLIVDNQNNKLKLYDSNNQYLSELVLPGIPLSVVILSDNEVMLSLPNITSLQYINIGTHLLSQTKKVNYQPGAMVKYGDDILATLRDVRDGSWKVAVIDNHGTVKITIYQDNGYIFSRPFFIGLSVDQKTVYVVDRDKGCIGLTMDGNVVFQYQDQTMKYYAGLAIGRASVFIGVTPGKGYSVRRLSLHGDFMEDMDLGNSVPLKISDNHLIIFNVNDQGEFLIKFYQLLEVNMS